MSSVGTQMRREDVKWSLLAPGPLVLESVHPGATQISLASCWPASPQGVLSHSSQVFSFLKLMMVASTYMGQQGPPEMICSQSVVIQLLSRV